MINLKGKDSVADAVKSILQIEEGSTEFAAAKGPKHTDELTNKLINKVEGDTPAETTARKSVKASGGHVEQPKVGVVRKESVTLKGFKQRYEEHSIFEQMVQEVLSKDASAGQWIHDFVHSDNPKFAGKSKAERKKQALAAYYAKQRNEEVESVEEELKGNQKKIDKNHNGKIDAQDFKILRKEDVVEEGIGDTIKKVAKKAAEVLGGPDDEGHKKDLQRKMGIPQTGKPSMAKQNEEAEQVEEGWDDMLKDVKAKRGPQPSGGSGIKQGSRYGGGKQKDKPEQDEDKKKVNEAKRPEDDSVPFEPPYTTNPQPTITDKSGAKHTPMSRAHHLARLAMSKVKKDLGAKKGK